MGSLDLAEKHAGCSVLLAGAPCLNLENLPGLRWKSGGKITKSETQELAGTMWQICTLLKCFAKRDLVPSSRQHS